MGKFHTRERKTYPIYDWTDKDVWLYLKREKVKIPEVYLFLWQVGSTKRQLRVSQFFSIDTARSLVQMNEYYPDLMERIIRREPNAYLAALYWDSEMFGRRSRKRKELEDTDTKRDYKAELLLLFSDMEGNFPSKHKLEVAKRYRNFFMSISTFATNDDYRKVYEGLIAGDPKMRNLRALFQQVYGKYIDEAKKAEKGAMIHG
jgi:predicted phosphoadenosine phosphosulfate sulfurtransferase